MSYPVLKISIVLTFLVCCKQGPAPSDASGNFEAIETIVSAEANGKIMELSLDEGDKLKEGQFIGFIDSTQFHLTKLQLEQNKKTILSARPDIAVQIASLNDELDNAISDKKRIENLVSGGVASQKQVDDMDSKISIIRSKISAQQSALSTTTKNINEQGQNIYAQLSLVDDQIRKCRITNPVNGTVLAKYAELGEVASVGRPLYKIAGLDTLDLRAYITGDKLSAVRLGQGVMVRMDDGKNGFKTYPGTIRWISAKSEFTPKTIQTRNERANLVFAIKVRVKNDGYIKIGMFGEVILDQLK
ncbi:MAG: HlyD family secretion protein [Chitinophagales bacterium]